MHANYHTHTVRCRHASGTEREYIETAIANGLTVLGFSDHTPQPCKGDYYPAHQKMYPYELEDYVTTILDLKKEYASKIRILLGLEVEYYPGLFDELMRMIEPYPVEYLLLGQHALYDGGPDDPFVFIPTDSEVYLKQYVSQCLEALDTGRFLYFAHPDVFHFTGSKSLYKEEMRRLCLRAKALGVPLEINLLGLGDHRHYPNPLFWEIAAETGNDAVLGSDAHFPQHVYRRDTVSLAVKMAQDLGLKIIPELL